jgi:hypothetical protein
MTKAQFITTPAGEQLVLMPREEYEALLRGATEEAADIAAIDESRLALAEGRRTAIPADVVFAMTRGVNPVKALRELRGLTQVQLAEQASIAVSHLSQIERGKAPGNRSRKALAKALGVQESLLVDD